MRCTGIEVFDLGLELTLNALHVVEVSLGEPILPYKDSREKIREAASYSGDTDVILFNVDSKSSTDSNTNKEAIKAAIDDYYAKQKAKAE